MYWASTRTMKQVSRCPPLRYGAELSSLAMSASTILMVSRCQVSRFQSPRLNMQQHWSTIGGCELVPHQQQIASRRYALSLAWKTNADGSASTTVADSTEQRLKNYEAADAVCHDVVLGVWKRAATQRNAVHCRVIVESRLSPVVVWHDHADKSLYGTPERRLLQLQPTRPLRGDRTFFVWFQNSDEVRRWVPMPFVSIYKLCVYTRAHILSSLNSQYLTSQQPKLVSKKLVASDNILWMFTSGVSLCISKLVLCLIVHLRFFYLHCICLCVSAVRVFSVCFDVF